MPYSPQDCETVLEAVDRLRLFKDVAAELNWSKDKVRRAYLFAAQRKAEGDLGHGAHKTLPGFGVSKVSTLHNREGEAVAQWVQQRPDAAEQEVVMRAWVEALVEDARGLAPLTPPPASTDADLLAVYPMGDPHFGLLSWAKETGDNFDLEIAESLTFGAVDRLVASAPPAETALLLNLGDYFHADNSTNRTPTSGANLDVDGRFARIAHVGFRAMVRCVRRCLEKHQKVIVRNNRGNHDPHQAYMLSLAVSAYFESEPRVEVDMSPASFYYYRFGRVLIGSTHGDGAKLNDLPLIMANDAPHDWAAATFRHWHCGHFHHDQMKEHPGATVETHRTLAGRDSWHTHQGYRAGRDMKAIIYHREHGEVTRIRCGINMLEAA